MERTIHFTLVDQVSTLNRITSAFVRLQCNIDELHVKHSDKEGISNTVSYTHLTLPTKRIV